MIDRKMQPCKARFSGFIKSSIYTSIQRKNQLYCCNKIKLRNYYKNTCQSGYVIKKCQNFFNAFLDKKKYDGAM